MQKVERGKCYQHLPRSNPNPYATRISAMSDSNRNNGKNNHSVFAILDKHTKNSDKTSSLQAEENFVVLDEFQTTSQRCDLFTLEYPIFSLSRIPNKEPFNAGQFTISPNSMQGQPTM